MNWFNNHTTSNQLNRLLIFLLALLTFGLFLHPLGDPDLYIHLRDGRYWLSSHFQVGLDPFSYTASDKPFDKIELLFKVGLYSLWLLGGNTLLIISKAALMTATVFTLGWLMFKRWNNLLIVTLLLGLAVLAPNIRIFPVRPFIFTYLFLPIVMLLLQRYRDASTANEPKTAKILWILPLIIIPWANLHPGFIVVFGFLGAHIFEQIMLWWKNSNKLHLTRIKKLLLISSASVVAGCINPIGFNLYVYVIRHLGSNDFMKYITEWAPPTLKEQPVFFGLIAVVVLTQVLTIRKFKWSDFLPMAAFTYMGIRSHRNIILFLIAILPPLTEQLRLLWEQSSIKLPFQNNFKKFGKVQALATIILVITVTTVTGYAFQIGEIPLFYPEKGLQWLSAQNFKGRILTHDIWGGYTGWKTEGKIKIFMDGRLEMYGLDIYSDYRAIIWGHPQKALKLMDKYKIEGILVSPKNEIKLYNLLWQSGQWALVYWDEVCQFYVKRLPEHESFIAANEYTAIDPKQTPFYHPQKIQQALLEAKRATEIMPDTFLPWFFMGELYIRTKQYGLAVEAFKETLKRSPDHLVSLHNLGQLALQNNEFDQAEQYFREVLQSPLTESLQTKTWFGLAITLSMDSGRKREALRYAKKALAAAPEAKPIQQLVERLELGIK